MDNNLLNNKTEKKPTTIVDLLKALAVLGFLAISFIFAGIGLYGIVKALFTEYTIQTNDILYFFSGTGMFMLFAILIILGEIKQMLVTFGELLIQVSINQRTKDLKSNINPLSNIVRNMFGQNNTFNKNDFKGSISVVDLNNPEKPIFKGDFNNIEEMQELRKKLLEKLLNSHGEFNGKKMTKQEMLDTMSIEELDAERIKAEKEEDWLWAAALRDKIKEKKGE
ncbi:MAG: hypothetical protein KatS3mg035_0982 [Bacteroidia bacterium]|nr:MAG: hypothetical protein KatS3mg035_0982 [Bacteroidia bacterium]